MNGLFGFSSYFNQKSYCGFPLTVNRCSTMVDSLCLTTNPTVVFPLTVTRCSTMVDSLCLTTNPTVVLTPYCNQKTYNSRFSLSTTNPTMVFPLNVTRRCTIVDSLCLTTNPTTFFPLTVTRILSWVFHHRNLHCGAVCSWETGISALWQELSKVMDK